MGISKPNFAEGQPPRTLSESAKCCLLITCGEMDLSCAAKQ